MCVVSASDLGGHAGFVTLTDDAYSTRADAEGASDEPDVDAAFPDDIVEPRRRPRLLLNRAFLRRANRPEVAPRRLAWSHPGAHDVRGGGCLLAVVSNTHRVTIHAPPIVETESEWRTIADLTNLRARACRVRDDDDDATGAPRGRPRNAFEPAASLARVSHTASLAAQLARASTLPSLPPAMRLSLPAPPRTVRATIDGAATFAATFAATSNVSASLTPPPGERRARRGRRRGNSTRRSGGGGTRPSSDESSRRACFASESRTTPFPSAATRRNGSSSTRRPEDATAKPTEPRPEPRPESCIPSPRRAPSVRLVRTSK